MTVISQPFVHAPHCGDGPSGHQHPRSRAAALAWSIEAPANDEATALLGRELIPLYIHYIDDHITRLRAVNRYRAADSFHRWRTRLLA